MNAWIKKQNIIILIIIIVFVALLSLVIVKNRSKSDTRDRVIGKFQNVEDVEWLTYTDEKFNFQIEYPSTWELFKQYNDAPPVISFYPKQKDIELPFTFYDDTVTVVSIYPQGSEAEALSGKRKKVNLQIKESVNISEDYLLKGGDVWANFTNFQNPPGTWQRWGFLWASATVKNVSYGCERNGNPIEIEECNPFIGDEITRQGKVDVNAIEIEKHILESFEFIEN
ncbi:hypothetical protein H6775_00090 [Candidatus Nomurabacteria bacterium]|nr:hypothetical protein [Candidatus Nomurabacteria bacterium]